MASMAALVDERAADRTEAEIQHRMAEAGGAIGRTPVTEIFSSLTNLPIAPAADGRGTLGRLYRAAFFNLFEFIPARAYDEPVCHFRFGGKNFVHVADPDILIDILVNQPHLYEKGESQREVLENTRGYGPLTARDAEWSRQRKMFAAFFTPRFAARVGTILDHVAARAVETLRFDPYADFLDEMQRAVLLSVYGSLFPELFDDDSGAAPVRGDLLDVIRLAGLAKARMSRIPESLTPGFARKRSAVAARKISVQMDDVFGRVIAAVDDRIRAHPEGLLYQILYTDVLPNSKKMEYLRSMFMSGQYPTESFLTTMFTLIAMNPSLQDRLRYLAADSDGAAFKETLALFEKECLRLFPPAPLLERSMPAEQPRAAWAGDAQSILVSPWVIHRHRALWSDTETFDPARFVYLTDGDLKGQYLPFGMGKRMCSGRVFAHMIAERLIAAVLGKLQLQAVNGPFDIRSKQALELFPRPKIRVTPV